MPKIENKRQLSVANGYAGLVKKIQTELSELDFFIKRRTAESYWKVGKFIHEHLLENKQRADYGNNIFERLENDVNRDATTLRKILKFYRLYPIHAPARELSWGHYLSLIAVRDADKRKQIENKVIQKGWDTQDLRQYLSSRRLQEALEKNEDRVIPQLEVTRSRLFTYQILEPNYIHPIEEHLVVDLGFNFLIHTEIKVRHSQKANGETSPKSRVLKRDFGGGIKLKAGELVESVPATNLGGSANFFGGKFNSYKFKHSEATTKELYTYKALVENIVDADTIWLNIDLGFDCWSRQKVRLRGIDAPEINTPKGKEAKEFVEDRLKEVNFVIVRTHKSDKYDRYLADIFYLSGETDETNVAQKGRYLNQELLSAKMALPF